MKVKSKTHQSISDLRKTPPRKVQVKEAPHTDTRKYKQPRSLDIRSLEIKSPTELAKELIDLLNKFEEFSNKNIPFGLPQEVGFFLICNDLEKGVLKKNIKNFIFHGDEQTPYFDRKRLNCLEKLLIQIKRYNLILNETKKTLEATKNEIDEFTFLEITVLKEDKSSKDRISNFINNPDWIQNPQARKGRIDDRLAKPSRGIAVPLEIRRREAGTKLKSSTLSVSTFSSENHPIVLPISEAKPVTSESPQPEITKTPQNLSQRIAERRSGGLTRPTFSSAGMRKPSVKTKVDPTETSNPETPVINAFKNEQSFFTISKIIRDQKRVDEQNVEGKTTLFVCLNSKHLSSKDKVSICEKLTQKGVEFDKESKELLGKINKTDLPIALRGFFDKNAPKEQPSKKPSRAASARVQANSRTNRDIT
jgi:hypothetical protein